MLDKYEWNKLFRERVIALCFLSSWYSRFGSNIVRPDYFELESEQDLVRFILDFYDAYGRPPEEDEVLAEFCNNEDVLELVPNVLEKLEEDLDFAQTRALQFAKEQSMKLAMLQSMQDFENGRFSNIVDRMQAALAIGTDLSDLGIDIDHLDSWALLEYTDKIPTGIMLVDNRLDGGLARGEYGVVLAPTNVGKTMMLVNLGFGAAGLFSRANVVHVTLEMSAKQIARRYGARIADYFITKDVSVIDYAEDFFDLANVRIFGNIRIKQFPTGSCTINELKSYLSRLVQNNYVPDMLIVDYPELMAHTKIGEYRHNISHTNTLLRGLGDESNYNMAVWGAAQTNRGGLTQEIVDIDTIAEDFGIAKIADVVLSLSQTKEEYAENLLRIYGSKIRGAEKNWIVRCQQIHKAHAIIGLEEITAEEMRKERQERRKELQDKDDAKQKIKEYAERKKNGKPAATAN